MQAILDLLLFEMLEGKCEPVEPPLTTTKKKLRNGARPA